MNSTTLQESTAQWPSHEWSYQTVGFDPQIKLKTTTGILHGLCLDSRRERVITCS